MKTGTFGRPWITLEAPRPPRVADRYAYWTDPPPEISDRARYWLRQIKRGWIPNRRIRAEGYDASAEWFGVWLWEYLHLIAPAVDLAVELVDYRPRWISGADEVERLSDEMGICRACGSDLPEELLRYSIDHCERCAGLDPVP